MISPIEIQGTIYIQSRLYYSTKEDMQSWQWTHNHTSRSLLSCKSKFAITKRHSGGGGARRRRCRRRRDSKHNEKLHCFGIQIYGLQVGDVSKGVIYSET